MKVISLLEPYASLIKEKKKLIETRSWKTEYRGELYIHASLKKLTNNDLEEKKNIIKLLEDKGFKYGYIIAKCKLVDCKYMDDKFIDEVKQKPIEYICGEYSVGRYGWILEDIEVLDEPIIAKGQLGIWNYYSPSETMNLLSDINYGWLDINNQKHLNDFKNIDNIYKLQSPKELINNKIGLCFDQVELERYYLKNNPTIKSYCIVHYDIRNFKSHTFLTYKEKNKYYWFEHAWEKFKGIHEYDSNEKLLCDVKSKFIKYELQNNCDDDKLALKEYKKLKYGISTEEVFKSFDK